MSKAAGIAKEQIQDSLFGKVGNAGAATHHCCDFRTGKCESG